MTLTERVKELQDKAIQVYGSTTYLWTAIEEIASRLDSLQPAREGGEVVSDTYGAYLSIPEKVALWAAVNEYAKATGGDASNMTATGERMDAVVAVTQAVESIVNDRAARSKAGRVDWGKVRAVFKVGSRTELLNPSEWNLLAELVALHTIPETGDGKWSEGWARAAVDGTPILETTDRQRLKYDGEPDPRYRPVRVQFTDKP